MKTTYKTSNVVSGADDDDVIECLEMVSGSEVVHNKEETIRQLINAFFTGGFTISDPTGANTISSKLILQILWKVANKFKIPDFKIYKSGPFKLTTDLELEKTANIVREQTEQIVTAAVGTVMKEGKFIQCMRDKGGAFYKMALYGDAVVQVGFDEDNSDYPIAYRVGSLSNYYVNSQATDIRDATGGLSADGDVYFYTYTMKQFENLWPDFKGKVAPGEIPKSDSFRKDLEKTWEQMSYGDKDTIEVGYYTSVNKVQVVFAGAACTVLRKYEGELPEGQVMAEDSNEFPFIIDKKVMLPTLHFKFFPSAEGFSNYGIGHMVYDIALLAAKMDNMAFKHAERNINPINFVNSTSKTTSKLFGEILKAEAMTNAGGRGYVVSENQQGSSGVTVESFQDAPITQEWERAFTRLETQINRLGFLLDAPDLGSSPNEMSIMSAQETADAPIKQVIEWNATVFEEAVIFAMDFIRKFVPDDDQTPLNSTVDLEMGDMQIPLRGIPLGWVAQELRKTRHFVVVNSRDGTVPSNVMELAKARETMSTLPQGTPAWNKMALKVAKLNGHNLTVEDMGMPAPQSAPAPDESMPTPTETTPLNAATLKYGR